MGSEFVSWKFGLDPIRISDVTFFDEVKREMFFRYKEISMSEEDIDVATFGKIVNQLVKTLKDIRISEAGGGTAEDALLDIREALGIEVIDVSPVMDSAMKRLENIAVNSRIK